MKISPDANKWLPTRQVLERYSICDRTLYRWIRDETLSFPRPHVVNGRRYFSETALIEWERSNVSSRNSEVA